MSDQEERSKALHRAVSTVQNLLPSAFMLAADPDADIKARWAAFDKVYEFVVEDMANKGTPLQPTAFKTDGLTEEQVQTISERSMRVNVATMLLAMAYGTSKGALSSVMWQVEVLVPSSPDPETWRPPLTLQDQVILFDATCVVRDDMPDDWHCFFQVETLPVEQRRLAFRRIYACVGAVWREMSEFARSLTPDQRQGFVAFALVSHVPKDQWTHAEFEEMRAELLPIEEPDWEELYRQAGPPPG
ncbi:MAG: hypothetical protein WD602_03110 [Actinomycetota bacterium]